MTVGRARGATAISGTASTAAGNYTPGACAAALTVGIRVTGAAVASGGAARARGATATVRAGTSGARCHRRRAI